MSEDIVERLRAADEWMLVGLEGVAFHDDAPFDAADEIERLRAELAAERDSAAQYRQSLTDLHNIHCGVVSERDELRAQLDEAREALEPFAVNHSTMEEILFGECSDDDLATIRVKFGVIRRARAVLKGDGDE